MSPEYKKLLEKYASEVAKFRDFCIRHGNDPVFEEVDFRDLSIGFFIALGVTESTIFPGEIFSDAVVLATICRYTFHYWEGESIGPA